MITGVILASPNVWIKIAVTTRNILIVEDNEAIQGLVRILVTRSGFTATVANDGAEAIRALSKTSFCVVVLDLMLPITSGYDVIAHIRNSALKVPVIVVTAVVKGFEMDLLDPAIVKAIIHKPFDLDILLQAIEAACGMTG